MLQLAIPCAIVTTLTTSFVALFRNRNPLAWFFIGALLPVYSIVLVCLLKPLGPNGKRTCEHCQEVR